MQSHYACPHSDIKIVLHLELFQTAQRLQSGNIFHLVVAEVQVAKRRQLQVLGQLLQSVPRQIPSLQGLETGQQPDWQVLGLQRQPRETEQQRASHQCFHKFKQYLMGVMPGPFLIFYSLTLATCLELSPTKKHYRKENKNMLTSAS